MQNNPIMIRKALLSLLAAILLSPALCAGEVFYGFDGKAARPADFAEPPLPPSPVREPTFMVYKNAKNAPEPFGLAVVGPCAEAPVFSAALPPGGEGVSVGSATVRALALAGLAYEGDEAAMRTILGTPVVEDAYEILPGGELRVYGWCFSVDGEVPQTTPDAVFLRGGERVVWFHAYSVYSGGAWGGLCSPSWRVKPRACLKPGNPWLAPLQPSLH